MKSFSKIAFILLFLLWQLPSSAQTEATVKLDTNSLLIGDQTRLELSFSCPSDYEVIWPDISDTIIKEIEILKHTPLESELSPDKYDKIYKQAFTITGFDSGYYAIPPFRIYYKIPGDTIKHFTESEAELLEIHAVSVDAEADIKDIKGPIEAPFTLKEAMPYILVSLGIAILAIVIIYIIRKRKKSEPVFKAPPPQRIPAHQLALDALESLRYKKLWQQGEIKKYHTELTDIIREYLFSKFSIHALEYTSDEIMEAVHGTPANDQAKDKLHQTLQMADMVKFAKMKPLPLEHDGSLNNAIDFVKETIHLNNQAENQPVIKAQSISEPAALPTDEEIKSADSKEQEEKEVSDV